MVVGRVMVSIELFRFRDAIGDDISKLLRFRSLETPSDPGSRGTFNIQDSNSKI